MSKNLAAGLAVLACLVVAGIGGYMAMQPDVPVVSAPEPGVSVSQDLVQATAPQQFPVTTGTENVIPEALPVELPPAPPATATPSGRSPKPTTRGDGNRPAATKTEPAAPPPAQNPSGGWTGVDKTWPSGNATADSTVPPPVVDPLVVNPPEPEPPQPPPGPPPKMFEELVVTADSVLGLQLDSTVSSEVAKVEDPVEARVTREVRVGSDVAIPAGTRVLGSVMQVERGGKVKEKARLGVRFHTLVMADGSRVSLATDAIYREGKSPGQESAAKVGAAAVGGAILGAIIGGGKGAAIGGSVGAAGGTAAVMAGGRNPAVLQAGTSVTVRLQQPVTITIER